MQQTIQQQKIKIPNDPAHPLRRLVFRWQYTGHMDHSDWYGESYRDDLHGVSRFQRSPRRRKKKYNRKMGTMFIIDGQTEEITYNEAVAHFREIEGEFFCNVNEHPLVKNGQEIEYTPSKPPFEVGTIVFVEPRIQTRERLPVRYGRIMKGGNSLYVPIEFEGGWNNQFPVARVRVAPEGTVIEI